MKNKKDYFECRHGVVVGTGVMLLLGVAALGLAGCKKQAAAPPPSPVVEVTEVAPTNVPMTTEIIGQLDSPENVEIRARVEGFVDKMLFTEGTVVREGDPLFTLDDKPFVQRLNAAKAGLEEARAALNKYEADVARLQPLADKKAVPRQDLDNAKASVDVGQASVLSAEARVEAATLDLSYCDIRAPITGLIGAKQVSIGDLVGKGQPTLMATISRLDPIWFYCSISEGEYFKAQTWAQKTGRQVSDLPITLLLANGAVHPEKGKIVFLDRAVDVKTGTLRVRAEFPNSQALLRPGMFGRVQVDLGVRPDSILVPERAVTELQGKNFVWVVDKEKKTSQRPVKVGEQFGENVMVTEGLKPGELVVVEGLQKVREGAVVQPTTAKQLPQEVPKPSALQAAKD